MADEQRSHGSHQVFAAHRPEQAGQGQLAAGLFEQFIQQDARLAVDQTVHQQLAGPAVFLVRYDLRQHRLGHFGGEVQQFLRVQQIVLQSQRLQAGGPQVVDGSGFVGLSLLSCGAQQVVTRGCVNVRLERGQGGAFLDLPVELAAGYRCERV